MKKKKMKNKKGRKVIYSWKKYLYMNDIQYLVTDNKRKLSLTNSATKKITLEFVLYHTHSQHTWLGKQLLEKRSLINSV